MGGEIAFACTDELVFIETALKDYPAILTGPQVAEILQIGRVKAYDLMSSGEIKSFRVGVRNIRTTKQILIRYIIGIKEGNIKHEP